MDVQADTGDYPAPAGAGHRRNPEDERRALEESQLDRLEDQAQVDRVARALAHPARRFTLELLVVGGAAASDLAASIGDTFGVSPARASQHLQVLARAGLVDVATDGPWRWYSLARLPGEALIAWLRGLDLPNRPGSY